MNDFNLFAQNCFSKLRQYYSVFFLTILICNPGFAQPPAPVEINGRWGFVIEKNILVIDTLFVMALPFNEYGLAAVVDDSGWVYIDTCGNKLFRPYIYDNGPDYFSEGLSRYKKNNKIGYVNEQGGVQISARFDFALPFSEGFAAFCDGCKTQVQGEHKILIEGKWGYINRKGEVILEPIYDKAGPFRDGRASVTIKDKKRIIDTQGNRID